MNPEVLSLIRRYDRLIRQLEEPVIRRLDASLDSAYREFEREFLQQYPAIAQKTNLLATQRRAVLINDLGNLLAVIRPEMADSYEQTFERLIRGAGVLGGNLAGELMRAIAPDSFVRLFAGIPLEAVALQARDARRRLYRYNETFQNKASAIIEQSLIQGWGPQRAAELLRRQMGLAKSKAEQIARTETLSSLNDAAQMRYQDNGVEGVQWIVTPSEQLCAYCAARNGYVYAVGKVRIPAHPLCRCVVLPWRAAWQADGLTADAMLLEYRRARLEELYQQNQQPNYGPTPFERAAGLTWAPEPLWKP
ncbi:minor capsid protein [Leptolyngbya sp. AN02str]|uniref:minor capsid protein n=1 Tax=Leptolyngbya sp. AN02str TaxID=3423363 RepID=UPI003D3107AC